jgi:hypothetical protein
MQSLQVDTAEVAGITRPSTDTVRPVERIHASTATCTLTCSKAGNERDTTEWWRASGVR